VEMRPSRTCSAARPPRAMHVMSSICSIVISMFSLGRYCAKPSAAVPRGTIDTCIGDAGSQLHACRKQGQAQLSTHARVSEVDNLHVRRSGVEP